MGYIKIYSNIQYCNFHNRPMWAKREATANLHILRNFLKYIFVKYIHIHIFFEVLIFTTYYCILDFHKGDFFCGGSLSDIITASSTTP